MSFYKKDLVFIMTKTQTPVFAPNDSTLLSLFIEVLGKTFVWSDKGCLSKQNQGKTIEIS